MNEKQLSPSSSRVAHYAICFLDVRTLGQAWPADLVIRPQKETRLPVVPSKTPGWIGVQCERGEMAIWLVRAIMDSGVRRVLLAAPAQSWSAIGDHLVSHSGSGFDPLDLLARATALRAVLQAVPWEAYSDRTQIPSPAAVQAALRTRRLRPVEELPSMPRHA